MSAGIKTSGNSGASVIAELEIINDSIKGLDSAYAMLGKPSGGDFVTTFNTSAKINCTELPTEHSVLTIADIVKVEAVTTTGVTTIYNKDEHTMTISDAFAPIYELTVNDAIFNATDILVVYTNVNLVDQVKEVEGTVADGDAATSDNPLKIGAKAEITASTVDDGDIANLVTDLYRKLKIAGYDDTQALIKTAEQSAISFHYTDGENIATSIDIGAANDTYVLQGKVDTRSFSTIGIFVNLVVNNSTGCQLMVKCLHDSGGSDEYELETVADYVKVIGTGSADVKKVFPFDVQGVNEIAIYTKATVVGATEGTVTIDVTQQY